MKSLIDGVVYDTNKANKIAEFTEDRFDMEGYLGTKRTEIWKSKGGKIFLVNEWVKPTNFFLRLFALRSYPAISTVSKNRLQHMCFDHGIDPSLVGLKPLVEA